MFSFIKITVKFLVNSNIFIALCALAATFQTYLLLDIPIKLGPLPVLVFFASLLVYNAHRLIALPSDSAKDASAMHTWMRDYSMIMIGFLGLSLFAVGMSFLMLNNVSKIALIVLGAISVLYVVPVKFPGLQHLRLRDFGVFKPFIVGLVWAFSTVMLPIFNNEVSIPLVDEITLSLQSFFFISALCIPFDVRDLEYDKATLKFPTIPMALGLKTTKLIGSLVLAVFFAIALYRGLLVDYQWQVWASYVATFLLSLFLILKTKPSRTEYYYTFWIDSMILLQFLIIGASVSLKIP